MTPCANINTSVSKRSINSDSLIHATSAGAQIRRMRQMPAFPPFQRSSLNARSLRRGTQKTLYNERRQPDMFGYLP
jgi:hypothetical protein